MTEVSRPVSGGARPAPFTPEWFRVTPACPPVREGQHPDGNVPGIDFNASDPDNEGRLPAGEVKRRIGKV